MNRRHAILHCDFDVYSTAWGIYCFELFPIIIYKKCQTSEVQINLEVTGDFLPIVKMVTWPNFRSNWTNFSSGMFPHDPIFPTIFLNSYNQ